MSVKIVNGKKVPDMVWWDDVKIGDAFEFSLDSGEVRIKLSHNTYLLYEFDNNIGGYYGVVHHSPQCYMHVSDKVFKMDIMFTVHN